MGARRAPLDPADVQCPRSELDLLPSKVNKLGRTKAMSVRHQDHRGVPMPPAVLLGGIHQTLNLSFSQVLPSAQVGIRKPRGHDCSVYDARRDEFQVCFGHVIGPPFPTDCWDNAPSLNSRTTKTKEPLLGHFDSSTPLSRLMSPRRISRGRASLEAAYASGAHRRGSGTDCCLALSAHTVRV